MAAGRPPFLHGPESADQQRCWPASLTRLWGYRADDFVGSLEIEAGTDETAM